MLTYCVSALDESFWVGSNVGATIRSSAVAWNFGCCRDETKYVAAATMRTVAATIHHPLRMVRM